MKLANIYNIMWWFNSNICVVSNKLAEFNTVTIIVHTIIVYTYKYYYPMFMFKKLNVL